MNATFNKKKQDFLPYPLKINKLREQQQEEK